MELAGLDDYGIENTGHYYFVNRAKFSISLEELKTIVILDSKMFVDKNIIESLKSARDAFLAMGLKLVIRDSYRSPESYQLAYEKRMASVGHAEGLNMKDMPHATGKSVDIALWTISSEERFHLYDKQAGKKGRYIDFYNEETDPENIYRNNQKTAFKIMKECGFEYGNLREVWHFNFKA